MIVRAGDRSWAKPGLNPGALLPITCSNPDRGLSARPKKQAMMLKTVIPVREAKGAKIRQKALHRR